MVRDMKHSQTVYNDDFPAYCGKRAKAFCEHLKNDELDEEFPEMTVDGCHDEEIGDILRGLGASYKEIGNCLGTIETCADDKTASTCVSELMNKYVNGDYDKLEKQLFQELLESDSEQRDFFFSQLAQAEGKSPVQTRNLEISRDRMQSGLAILAEARKLEKEYEGSIRLDEDSVERLNEAFKDVADRLPVDGEVGVKFWQNKMGFSFPSWKQPLTFMTALPVEVKDIPSVLEFTSKILDIVESKAQALGMEPSDQAVAISDVLSARKFTDIVRKQEVEGIPIPDQCDDIYNHRDEVLNEALAPLVKALKLTGIQPSIQSSLDTLSIHFQGGKTADEFDDRVCIPLPAHAATKNEMLSAISKRLSEKEQSFDSREALESSLKNCWNASTLVEDIKRFQSDLSKASRAGRIAVAYEVDGVKEAYTNFAKVMKEEAVSTEKTRLQDSTKKLSSLGLKEKDITKLISKSASR